MKKESGMAQSSDEKNSEQSQTTQEENVTPKEQDNQST
jgi:hypothetical protein